MSTNFGKIIVNGTDFSVPSMILKPAIKTKRETFHTSEYGWVFFPEGLYVINAKYGIDHDYNILILDKYYNETTGVLKFRAKKYLEVNESRDNYLPTNTDVIITYDYLDTDADYPRKDEYSTDEIVIGKWIDGKPIYRQVHIFDTPVTIPLTTWTHLSWYPQNVDMVISCSGWSITDVDKVFQGNFLADNLGNIQAQRNGMDASVKCICFEYTKTTN